MGPGIIGGPSVRPLIENAPLPACATGGPTAKPAYGPLFPKPLMRASISPGATAPSVS